MSQIKVCESCGYAFSPRISDKQMEELLDPDYEEIEEGDFVAVHEQRIRRDIFGVRIFTQNICDVCFVRPLENTDFSFLSWGGSGRKPKNRIRRLMPPE
jgi:hypothetical protein